MKTKKPLYIITIIFAFLFACQSAQPSSNNTPNPALTQGIDIQPTDELKPTETPIETNLSINEITDDHNVLMIYVPEGEFTMGGVADDAVAECENGQNPGNCKPDAFLDEEPLHVVNLSAYYIDKYEVTNGLYQECVNSGTCASPIESSSETYPNYYTNSEFNDYPVIFVDWNMANTYCEWRGARLPSEAEWEKAGRGTDERIYPWGNTFNSYGNFCDKKCLNIIDIGANQAYDDGYIDTAPVDSYPEGISPYGVYNLAGNVWEWVADIYSDTYYGISPAANPKGPDTGDNHVLRGGAFNSYKHVLRSLNRINSNEGGNNVGFRCAKEANP